MNRLKTNANTLDILKYIMRHNKINRTDWTIVISGRVGPTGKTWLCNELVKAGYRATEHDQLTVARLLMDDGMNHVFVDERVNLVTVILNEILPMYENKWRMVSDFDPTDVYTFKTRAEAFDILEKMRDIAMVYGSVTQADFKTLLGKPANSEENKYGWLPNDIRKAQVIRLEHGYFIGFPKSLPID